MAPDHGPDRATLDVGMSYVVHLLGRPWIDAGGREAYRFRSRKSWALLTYLLRNERPPSRRQLASLLFSEADDPLRALRWCLAEIRRALGEDGCVGWDPVTVELPPGSIVDVDVIGRGSWVDAVALPGLGSDLLEGLTVRDAPAFESWLLAEQRHVAAASEAILHEAALGSLARGDVPGAIGYALRASAMNPLDENHQALLVRLHRLAGDEVAAARQFAGFRELLARELGVEPGGALLAAAHEPIRVSTTPTDGDTVAAVIETAAGAVSAGAVDAGVRSLRAAVTLADDVGLEELRVRARVALAETLIHSIRGFDEEGLALLYEVEEIALASGDVTSQVRARAELGYVDFLRARYERAEYRFRDALVQAEGDPSTMAKVASYLGSVLSDLGSYPAAIALLTESVEWAQEAGEPRREAYSRSMLGRVELLRGRLDDAAAHLDASIRLAEQDHWLAFAPWPQALRGELHLASGDVDGAEALLRQSFARACQVADPCWEGTATRGLALVADARGDAAESFRLLADAERRANRHADPYVWLDGYILDARCALGLRHRHPETARWIEQLRELASRTGMKELLVRSHVHAAGLGDRDAGAAAAFLVSDVDNDVLHRLVDALGHSRRARPVVAQQPHVSA